MSFVGHEAVLARLLERLKEDSLPGGQAWIGPEGVGKRLVAEAFAKHLLCEASPQVCGECRSCHLISTNQHPDLHRILPENRRIKIDSIRELQKTMRYAPLVGSRRLILIDDAHFMNNAAANALLKSLEEPGARQYFILITHASGALPKTILSRCHKVNFPPLEISQVRRIAKDLKLEASEEYDRLSQGSVAKRVELARLNEIDVAWERLLSPARSAFGFAEAYALTQELMRRELIPLFLQALLQKLHEALRSGEATHRFARLAYVDRILEVRDSLRLNFNPAIHVTRLLLYFQETEESRL